MELVGGQKGEQSCSVNSGIKIGLFDRVRCGQILEGSE